MKMIKKSVALVKTLTIASFKTTKVLELLHLLFQAVLESLVDEPSMNSDVDMSLFIFFYFLSKP